MDYLQQFISEFRSRLLGLFLINDLVLAADWYLANYYLKLRGYFLLATIIIIPLATVIFLAWLGAVYLSKPSQLLWQAILHTLPDSTNIPAPNLMSLTFGREFVSHLTNNVYQLAIDGARLATREEQSKHDLRFNGIATKLPLPLIVLDAKLVITFANASALHYLGTTEADILGKPFRALQGLSFQTAGTFETWLSEAQGHSVSAWHSWRHVKLTSGSKGVLQFDMAASYSKDDPENHEILVAMFDQTASYEEDDQNLSFISLVVHELRTPLSLLQGYIELFEQELGGKLDPEMTRFMYQMKSAGQSLASFVSNVLTVARFESNQLELQLTEENWATILNQSISDMQLRAQVQGFTIETDIPDDLPPVGANLVTASEVIINLIDNAIKYSQHAAKKVIIIKVRMTPDGMVETTVKDFGVGIPASVIPHLFEKFYRNYRNRTRIGGTGLGLYLCRMIVEAHGGHIWVQSQDGQGATFGFTLKPYNALASDVKNRNNTDIVHSSHGWVKNHSLYRS